jgi:hypothetical protein
MHPVTKNLLLPLSALAILASAASAQSVLYRETFSATTAFNNSQPGTVGWAVHSGSAVYYSDFGQNAAGVGSGSVSLPVNGIPTDVSNVNAGSQTSTINPSGQTATGIFFVSTGINGTTPKPAFLAWTNEAGPIAASTVGNISFYLGSTSGAQPVRVAVQVGGSWYVSTETFQDDNISGGASGFAAGASLQSFNFTTAASAWQTVSFQQSGSNPLTSNGTGNLTITGTALSALSGNITAFGIYGNNGSSATTRFDTYTITAIPEPSSFAALAGLGALGLVASRRRRR